MTLASGDHREAVGLFFDLDDTLYKESDFRLSGFKAVADYIEQQYLVCSERFLSEIQQAVDGNGLYCGYIFNEVVDRLDVRNKPTVSELVEVYRNHTPLISLYDDAEELFSIILGRCSLGLITGGLSRVQSNKVKTLRLSRYFANNIIYASNLGADLQKPSPFPFRKMLELTGVSSERAFYIGDNPYKDFIGPHKLGLGTVRLLRGRYADVNGGSEYGIDATVENLLEILEVIER